MEFKKAFESDSEVQSYGPNARLIFAMMLKFDEIDPHSLAAECLTDKKGDKKIDFVRYDSETGRITLAQGYMAKDWKKTNAPANKASDLNTAVGWLLSGVCTQRLSDSEWQSRALGTENVPLFAKPGGACLCSTNSA